MVNGFLLISSVTIYILCLMLLLIAAVIDLKYKIIPNWIIFSIVFIGLSFNSIPPNSLKNPLYGLGAGFFIMLPVYLLKGWGAGDVKLIAAIGSVVGIDKIIDIIFYSLMGMGALSLPFVLFTKDSVRQLPMAPAITLASYYVLLPSIIL